MVENDYRPILCPLHSGLDNHVVQCNNLHDTVFKYYNLWASIYTGTYSLYTACVYFQGLFFAKLHGYTCTKMLYRIHIIIGVRVYQIEIVIISNNYFVYARGVVVIILRTIIFDIVIIIIKTGV